MCVILVYIYDIDFFIHQTRNVTKGDITVSFPIQALHILPTRLINLKISIKKKMTSLFKHLLDQNILMLGNRSHLHQCKIWDKLGGHLFSLRKSILKILLMFQVFVSLIKMSSKKHVIMKNFDAKRWRMIGAICFKVTWIIKFWNNVYILKCIEN